jgi:hypothetical protein
MAEGGAGHEGGDIQIPIVWEGLDELPVYSTSQILSQFTDDMFVISFGMLTPPALIGTPEERREQAKSIGYVPIRPIVRLGLTENRVEQLIAVLQENLRNFRNAAGE